MLIRFFCFSATTGGGGATGIGPRLTTAGAGMVGSCSSAFMTDVRREEDIFGSEVLRLIPLPFAGRLYRFWIGRGRGLLDDGAISRSSEEAVLLPEELTRD